MIASRGFAAAVILVLATCGNLQAKDRHLRPDYDGVPEAPSVPVDPPGVDHRTEPGSCFLIHYVTAGPHAPDLTDVAPKNHIPDYVDLVREALLEAYDKEVVKRGWPAPPSDAESKLADGNGGDGRLDVYIVTEPGIGAVYFEANVAPGSSRAYTHMKIDPNVKKLYGAFDLGPSSIAGMTLKDVVRDVIAHEYFHVLQYGIQSGGGAGSLSNIQEGTANWMNDEANDGFNVNVKCEALGHFEPLPQADRVAGPIELRDLVLVPVSVRTIRTRNHPRYLEETG